MNIHLFRSQLKKALDHIRREGLGSLLKIVSRRLRSSRALLTKPDVVHAYRFLEWTPSVQQPDHAMTRRERSVNWYIPPIGKGSGGHLNIFRFLRYLGDQGFSNRVIIVDDESHLSIRQVQKQIRDWFDLPGAEVFYINDIVPSAAVSIATSWQTAYAVHNLRAQTHKCYFVQDYEPWFFPAGTEYALAEQTYRFGFHGFTAGDWLARRLADEFSMVTTPLGFSYDRDLYGPVDPPFRNEKPRIFFYVRPPTARRAFDLGVLVFAELGRRLSGFTVVMAGWDVSHYAFPFTCEHAGLMNQERLRALYQSCDAALVLSFTNVSLLPLEIMACGVPVVSNRAEFTEWLLNDDVAMLAEPTVDGLANALEEVLGGAETALRLRQNGLALVASTSWEAEGKKFSGQVAALVEGG